MLVFTTIWRCRKILLFSKHQRFRFVLLSERCFAENYAHVSKKAWEVFDIQFVSMLSELRDAKAKPRGLERRKMGSCSPPPKATQCISACCGHRSCSYIWVLMDIFTSVYRRYASLILSWWLTPILFGQPCNNQQRTRITANIVCFCSISARFQIIDKDKSES